MSDEPLGCLLRLVWLPYQFWKAMCEESRVGTSEMDREVGKFWKWFAVISSVTVVLAVIAWLGLSLAH